MRTSTELESARPLMNRTPASGGVEGFVTLSFPQPAMPTAATATIARRERRISSAPEKSRSIECSSEQLIDADYCCVGGPGVPCRSGVELPNRLLLKMNASNAPVAAAATTKVLLRENWRS